MTVSVLLRLDESLKHDLDEAASLNGTSTQAFIRQAIIAALAAAANTEQAWRDWITTNAVTFNSARTPVELDAERAELWS